MFRAFIEPAAAEPPPCMAAARRLLATSGRGIGTRELTGPLVAAFGEDATVTVVDPALRLGPAGLAGLARLPGAPSGFALDRLGQRLFMATQVPAALAMVDLATRRTETVLTLDAPVAALAWDASAEALLVLGMDGALSLRDPDTLQPRIISKILDGASGRREAVAALPRERLLVVAGSGRLWILESVTLRAVHVLPLSEGDDAEPVRIAVSEETATLFASAGHAALALHAVTGRVLARFDLPAPPRMLLPLSRGRAVAPLADGSVVVLDAAAGLRFDLASAGTTMVEAGLAGSTLYLRAGDTPQLALLDTERLRPGQPTQPAMAEAGTSPFGEAGLPLLAPLGEAMLIAHPGDRRIYMHHGMGMVAPRAAFAAGGSPLAGLVALAREPMRTGAARMELTAEAPAAGSWRLVFAVADQGRAICHDLVVTRENAG
ncbi:hypothetical protein [Muricoccus pecuniae]|uniref:Uncharacterized protein n=1 Tax=Muricoccus pecuniae TaxID=693023 RepID=A0A840YHR8_9PROT|nr:hypothetical protein [Roseomonas pecuniae]MBB5695961.1 hypothetical protein [Roseomonas pecuniae]